MADCPRLGDVKNRYLNTANEGQKNESDEEVEDNAQIDEKGDKVEKSGGKVEIVKSADGVGNIRNRFGSLGNESYQKSSNPEGQDRDQVDSNAVNSARNLFKNFENQKQEEKKSFNRPTTKKRDPKEIMEMRKKQTYGNEEEIPEDGVVKKSVVLDENELGGSESRREALQAYTKLQQEKNLSDSDQGYGGSNSPASPTSTLSDGMSE